MGWRKASGQLLVCSWGAKASGSANGRSMNGLWGIRVGACRVCWLRAGGGLAPPLTLLVWRMPREAPCLAVRC